MDSNLCGNIGDTAMVVRDLQVTRHASYRPFHTLLVPIPMVCFAGALATDLAYWKSAEMMWADTSAWLLAVGLLFGLVAIVAAAVDAFAGRLSSMQGRLWPYVICNALILVLSFFNALIHSRDAWTSVVPMGLILSIVTVVFILFSGWIRWALIDYENPGVEP
ncbi:putative membrane protein [Rhizobium sp. BK347]|nr:putative membrane protein [Rhizobium sp. BK252]MBB3401803.1 putative membrane protein [Rhizobium sp. BK289]MBB3414253.1 putative membrane protein [Rhizobium sp. BK284]MBB3482140.1 putative membrane protein [Rhizobium sp. BK347]